MEGEVLRPEQTVGKREVVRVDEDLGTSRPSHLSLRLGSWALIISTPTLSLQIDSPFTFARPLGVITGLKYYSWVKPALLGRIQKV